MSKLNNFLNFYNLLILNLNEQENNFSISFYYLNNCFNIIIKNETNNSLIFQYNITMNIEEYNYLTYLISLNFINNHDILLPYFSCINYEDAQIYYKNSNSLTKLLDYEKAKIHILKNSKYEIKLYYFNGLNELSYEIHDKAFEKINTKIYKI